MPFILPVPWTRNASATKVLLPKEGLKVDSRVIKWDVSYDFECKVEGNILTVQCTNMMEGLPSSIIYFRVYDPSVEKVPPFDTFLYTYHGLEHEQAPFMIQKVIVDPSVKIIREHAFSLCRRMETCVMGDNVEKIELEAFKNCGSLRKIRLSRSLRCIGNEAFYNCLSLEVLFIPSTLKKLGNGVFMYCINLVIAVLPPNLNVERMGCHIFLYCFRILQNATNNGILYNSDDDIYSGDIKTCENQRKELDLHLYDNAPFLKICADPCVTAQTIRGYIRKHGTAPAYQTLPYSYLTPLHLLAHPNHHASSDAITACYDANPSALFAKDSKGRTPLDALWMESDVDTIVYLVMDLCINRLKGHKGVTKLRSSKRKRRRIS